MRKVFFLVIVLGLTMVPARAFAADPRESVVKIFVTSNRVDYAHPWQMQGSRAFTGSGFVIEGNQILTNAHVVADNTFIQVRKEGTPQKYTAHALALGYDCDLALLTVDDPKFFEGLPALKFGELPHLQDSVTVVGFPLGGDKISITEGVVSRIEIIPYVESAKKLLGVQIDAPINPGNSGGPVLKDGKVVGVAMQMLPESQNIGYMIPPPIIDHFMKDFSDGTYHGFPTMGIEFLSTESPALKDYYHETKEAQGGVVISWIAPYSSADGILAPEDILLAVDNVPIGEDGTFEFRPGERLAFGYLITAKQLGEDISAKILRAGKVEQRTIKLRPFVNFVSYPHELVRPPYYIYGGLIFSTLTVDLLSSKGQDWWKESPVNYLQYIFGTGRLNSKRLKQLVILLEVLPDDVNIGYLSYRDEIIQKVNGQDFSSFEEFVKLIEHSSGKFIVFETDQNEKIILNSEGITEKTTGILLRNNIPRQYSEDVEKLLQKK